MRLFILFVLTLFILFQVGHSQSSIFNSVSLSPDKCGIEFDHSSTNTNCFEFKACALYHSSYSYAGNTNSVVESAKDETKGEYVKDVASRVGHFSHNVNQVHKYLKQLFAADSDFLKKNDIEFINKLNQGRGFDVTIMKAKELLNPSYATSAYEVNAIVCPK